MRKSRISALPSALAVAVFSGMWPLIRKTLSLRQTRDLLRIKVPLAHVHQPVNVLSLPPPDTCATFGTEFAAQAALARNPYAGHFKDNRAPHTL